jgi:hypothetical protein
MIDKEHILSEIRRTAKQNGGEPLGMGRFATETGIRQSDWRGRYWARWGDALEEAGLQANQFNARLDDEAVLAHLILETRRLGHLPTTAELRLRRREDSGFPSAGVFERLGSKAIRAGLMADYCREHSGYADVLEIVMPLLNSEEAPSSNDDAGESVEYGFVYMLKSGRYYKVGATNSFGRREREIALQLPERATTVHMIKTDDPFGIEHYWQRRFADRRRNGEWFDLTPADVSAFKRRKFM